MCDETVFSKKKEWTIDKSKNRMNLKMYSMWKKPDQKEVHTFLFIKNSGKYIESVLTETRTALVWDGGRGKKRVTKDHE